MKQAAWHGASGGPRAAFNQAAARVQELIKKRIAQRAAGAPTAEIGQIFRDPLNVAFRQPIVHADDVAMSPSGLAILERVLSRFRTSEKALSSTEKDLRKLLKSDRITTEPATLSFSRLGLRHEIHPLSKDTIHAFARRPAAESTDRLELEALLATARRDPSRIGLPDFDPDGYENRVRQVFESIPRNLRQLLASKGKALQESRQNRLRFGSKDWEPLDWSPVPPKKPTP